MPAILGCLFAIIAAGVVVFAVIGFSSFFYLVVSFGLIGFGLWRFFGAATVNERRYGPLVAIGGLAVLLLSNAGYLPTWNVGQSATQDEGDTAPRTDSRSSSGGRLGAATPTKIGVQSDPAAPFTGTWEGVDTTGNDYVIFRLAQNGFDVHGTVEYPSVGCKGKISTPRKGIKSQVEVTQSEMQGSGSSAVCSNGLTWWLLIMDRGSPTAIAKGSANLTITHTS